MPFPRYCITFESLMGHAGLYSLFVVGCIVRNDMAPHCLKSSAENILCTCIIGFLLIATIFSIWLQEIYQIFHIGWNIYFKISVYNCTKFEHQNIGLWYQIQYLFKMVLLVCSLYYSDNILIIGIQTDPIYYPYIQRPQRNKCSIIDSKSRIGFEIPTPASPGIHSTFCIFKIPDHD